MADVDTDFSIDMCFCQKYKLVSVGWYQNKIMRGRQGMKKLSIVCVIVLVILSAGQAFALPGVYRAGSPTMDLYVGECETRIISMDGTGWAHHRWWRAGLV